MRHVAVSNTLYRLLPLAALLPLLVPVMAAAGGAPQQTALAPSPETPAVIYAIPQAQAFAMARQAIQSAAAGCDTAEVNISEASRGGGIGGSIRGYEAVYRGETRRFMLRRWLYVIPAAGITASGQPVDGFRFEITYDLLKNPGSIAGPGAACEKVLAGTLQTALDATGTAATVTGLRLRPYGEGRAAP
jgi:hypothetical protein